jgi:hypothetical protein
LGIVEERSSKNKGVLAIIKNEQGLVVNYASNVDFHVFASPIEHSGVARDSF